MTKFVFPAAPQPSLTISGSDARFPVRRIWCVGRNYLAHVRELGNDERESPFFFAKHPDMVVADASLVHYPSKTKDMHHEVELVVALKSGGSDIAAAQAMDCVFGYAVGIDLTRRDLQNAAKAKGQPWEVGKSFEQSAPCGTLTPAAGAGDIESAAIVLTVNGEVRQKSSLANMIWNIAEIIAHLSGQVELAPGDIIFTGTPEGVGPVVRGDRLEASVTGLSPLNFTIS